MNVSDSMLSLCNMLRPPDHETANHSDPPPQLTRGTQGDQTLYYPPCNWPVQFRQANQRPVETGPTLSHKSNLFVTRTRILTRPSFCSTFLIVCIFTPTPTPRTNPFSFQKLMTFQELCQPKILKTQMMGNPPWTPRWQYIVQVARGKRNRATLRLRRDPKGWCEYVCVDSTNRANKKTPKTQQGDEMAHP